MSYTRIEQNPDKTYSLYFNDNFYTIFTPYYRSGSYYTILYRLFGLLPQDFYHYAGATYHATFKPSPHLKSNIYMLFSNKNDIMAFANEIDKRISYCVKRGDFK